MIAGELVDRFKSSTQCIDDECNLKAVALKALKSRNRLCEEDSQRATAGRFGEEYASPSGGAWPEPGGAGP